MDHREARCSAERTKRVEILFPYYPIGCFPYYLLFFKILFFQFAFIKKILSICFIRQVPSILKILNQNFYLFIYFFFPSLCKTKNAGPVPFPAFVGRLSHDRSSSVSHRYKSTAESSSPHSLPKNCHTGDRNARHVRYHHVYTYIYMDVFI